MGLAIEIGCVCYWLGVMAMLAILDERLIVLTNVVSCFQTMPPVNAMELAIEHCQSLTPSRSVPVAAPCVER